jgi:glyoxylase-like metal-dependent hydrolase (beta-lactamase superfamily II)
MTFRLRSPGTGGVQLFDGERRVQLTSEVSVVGGGVFGFDLSAPFDCNVYLLDGGDELALIDAGIGGSVGDSDRLLRNIEAAGYDPRRIARIFLTHYHTDHAGGAAELHEKLGVPIHGSPLTATTLVTGDTEQNGLALAKAAGLFPADYEFSACPVVGDMTDGATTTVGELIVTAYETPGHCDGHVSYLVQGRERSYLLEGDVVFYGGKIFLQNIPDCSLQKYAESVTKLAALEFDAFLPGHLGISLANGRRHIEAAKETFDKLLVPASIV